jgi:hypothetical protein
MPRIYDFNDFIKHLYGTPNSVFTCVTGPNGSGKTEFNLLQLERIHDLGLGVRYGSNMPTPEHLKPNFEMDFIEDFETLEKICQMLNPPNTRTIKKYFFFLSELGKFVPKDEAWKKDNIKFIQKLQTPRKIGLNMLTDGIDRIDGRVLNPMFFNGEFKKPYSDNPKYAKYKDYRSGRTFTFKDIPKCEMWFDTYYPANFYIDKQKDVDIPFLNADHELVKKYREAGTCKKAGIHPQELKRARDNIIDYHFEHCLTHQEKSDKQISTATDEI